MTEFPFLGEPSLREALIKIYMLMFEWLIPPLLSLKTDRT